MLAPRAMTIGDRRIMRYRVIWMMISRLFYRVIWVIMTIGKDLSKIVKIIKKMFTISRI